MTEKFTNAPGENYEQDKAAEEISNASRDKIDDAQAKGQDVYDSTPKTPEEQAEKMGTAYKSKKILEEKNEKKKKSKGKKQEKFEVDLDNYMEFVDKVTSNASKDYNALLARYEELKEEGCKIQRLDTAASGMSAEGGEFMEIVKKIKYQGKPWNEDTKDHLIKELGDVLWYAQNACAALDIRMDEVIYINTLKLAARYPKMKFDEYYSENRKPGDI